MASLFEQIKQFSYSLGFVLVGVTAPTDLRYFSLYQKWLAHDNQATMQYLASKNAVFLRENPAHIMPTCQSILVLAYPYPLPLQNAEEDLLSIASYAQGVDYHVFLHPLLAQIVQFIHNQYDQPFQSFIFTDSGPLLEREIAYQAQLGWIGKNSCLINQKFGSSFFLSEILLDFPLTVLSKIPQCLPERCGTCCRCIEQCPTHCIQTDRTIDARKCISYLTIENKGEIPLEFRKAIGNHLFGCDICQQCCPWNQKASVSWDISERSYFVQDFFKEGNCKEVFSEADFKTKFSSSAILRAKRRGFYRNLAVVLGNQGRESNIPFLYQLLCDKDALVRQHAAWALGRFQSEAVRSHLEEALQAEQNENVILEIRQAIEFSASSQF